MIRDLYEMLAEQFAQWFSHIMSGTNLHVSCSLLVFISVCLLVKLLQWLKYRLQYEYSLPPGPWGMPIWGYLPFIKGNTHLCFTKLAKKYGKVFSIRFGSEVIVVISDYHLIRETFKLEEFTGRPHTDFMNIIDGYGVINTEGPLWKEERRFIHNKLAKNFGNEMDKMNSRIMGEVQKLLQELSNRRGAPTNLSPFLALSISNVICSLSMGVRFDHGDLQFKRFMELIDEGFKLFASLSSANYIPFLRYLPYTLTTRNKIAQNRKEMAEFFQQIIDKHRATFDKNNIRDIIDAYLNEIEEAKDKNRDHELFQGKDKDRQMQQILGDLFSAGMETVKNTLEWAVVFMLHNPGAAKAVQNELDQVVGRSRLPSLEDRDSLPITKATIQEILRRSNLVPLGTPHATTRDVTWENYTLPAGTQVVPLLYAVHMDPDNWNQPEVFRPERFFNKDKVCTPNFMPFGVGRRMCLGETLARKEIFLFFSSLMHRFNLRLPEGASLPSLNGNVGITISPEPFKVCLLQRDLDLDCDSNETVPNGPLRNIGSH